MTKAILYAVLMTGAARGQQFEVASIRQQPYNPVRLGSFIISGSQVNIMDTLNHLILNAYDLRPFQISGVPSWGSPTGAVFVIAAKAAGDVSPTRDQAKVMVQKLLVDRFQLKFHRETKELPVYELVIAKGGLKIKPTPEDSSGGMGAGNGRIRAPKITMSSLANGLTTFTAGRPVLDKTGLTGNYGVSLEWAPDDKPNDPGPSLFTAVEEQLGLKLEATKAPIEMLIVDQVEKPSEN